MNKNIARRGFFSGAAASFCVLSMLALPNPGIAAETKQVRDVATAAMPTAADVGATKPQLPVASAAHPSQSPATVNSTLVSRSFAATVDRGPVSPAAAFSVYGSHRDGALTASASNFATVLPTVAATTTAGSNAGGGDIVAIAPGGETGATLNAARVPEPETYAMMLAGLGLMGFVARRRRPVQERA